MGRRRGQGPHQPIKGFRPGKEPPHLKKQRARQQFGEVNSAQERLIEMFAERSPDESRAMLRRWRLGLLVAAIALAVIGVALYAWSVIAGIVVHVLAAIAFVLWWQLHRQREGLEAMAEAVHGPGGGRRKK
jgi:Flp pilus assembly protein TadB